MDETEQAKIESFYIDITDCPRCGGRHSHFIFQRFKTNPISFEYLNEQFIKPVVLDFWGTCPRHGEPILFKRIELK